MHARRRRWSWLRLALVAVGPLLAGVALAHTEIELWTIELAPTFDGYMGESLARYQKQRPDVTVVWRDAPLATFEAELAAAEAAGSAPDVVNVNVPLALDFAERGWLADLGPELDTADRARYFANLLASFHIGERQLALPWYLTVPVLFYDPELFTRAGLDPARPPATSAGALADARQLHDRLGIPGIWPNLAGQQLLYRFEEAGLPILDAAGTRAVFDSPEHASYLGQLATLYQQGVIPSAAFTQGAAGAADAFLAGKLAMLTANPQILTRMRASNPDLYARVGIAPYPLGPGDVIHAPLMGLAVTSASRAPSQALDLVRFLTGSERQLAFAKVTAIDPSARAAAADPYFQAAESGATPEERARQVAAAQLRYARDLTVHVPNASELFAYFQKKVEEALTGFRSPQDALAIATRFWDALL